MLKNKTKKLAILISILITILISKKEKKNVKKQNSFTIITPVYNCEKYLPEYFESIKNQTYESNKIKLVLVDDGSTDSSAAIINSYECVYIYQKNKGIAYARNKGLSLVDTDFYIFIDADDFIDKEYFKNLNDAINKSNSNVFVTNLYHFYERDNLYKKEHFLSYRFNEKFNSYTIDINKKNLFFVTTSTHTAFKSITNKLEFRNIRPQFEDTFYINEYILNSNNTCICFVPNAYYYYRKREDSNSTMDNVYKNKERYTILLKEGYLKILEVSGCKEYFIKKAVKYDFKFNKNEKCDYLLSKNEKVLRNKYIEEIEWILKER